MDCLTKSFRLQREHPRHAEGRIVRRNERAPDARRKILVVRRFLDHLRRDEDLGDAAQIGELAVVRIELRINSQASIVLGDLVLCRGAPDAGNDESLFGVDFVGNWQACSRSLLRLLPEVSTGDSASQPHTVFSSQD